MGMYMTLRTISKENIPLLLEAPSLIRGLLCHEEPSQPISAAPKVGFWGRMFGKSKKPDEPSSAATLPVIDRDDAEELDLDKGWHVVHFVLTGTAWEGEAPSNFLLLGGKEVGDIDVGYGPARVLLPSEVAEALEVLKGLSEERIRASYNVEALKAADIYPSIWDDPDPEDSVADWVLEHIADLKAFLAEAVARDRGIIIAVT